MKNKPKKEPKEPVMMFRKDQYQTLAEILLPALLQARKNEEKRSI